VLERRLILRHDDVLARQQRGDVAAGEIEVDAVGEVDGQQVDGRRADVLQFDELEQIAVLEPCGRFAGQRFVRIVIDFGNRHRRRHGRVINRLAQRAPLAADADPRQHGRTVIQRYGPAHCPTHRNRRRRIDTPAGQSRIAPIERIVDRPGPAGIPDRKQIPRVDFAAELSGPVDLEVGRVDRGIEAGLLVVEHDLIATGTVWRVGLTEVMVHQPVLFRDPVVVLGVESVRTVSPRMHVAAVVPPAGRLGDDRQVELVGAVHPPGGRSFLGYGAAVVEVFVEPVGEEHYELLAPAEVLEEAAGSIVVVLSDAVGGDAFQDTFGIPTVDPPWRIVGSAAGGPPVVAVPVGVAAVVVDDHVVDQGDDVELLRNLLELGEADVPVCRGGGDHRLEVAPGVGRCRRRIDGRAAVQGVKVVFIEVVIQRVMRGLLSFVDVVDAPIEPVEVKVVEITLPGVVVAHRQHRVAGPLVADHRPAVSLAVVPMDPRVIEHCPKLETIELVARGALEQRVIEPPHAVLLAEPQAHGVFGRLVLVPAGPALHLQAGVDLEALAAVGKDPLGRGRLLFGRAPGSVVQASACEDVFQGQHQGKRGDRRQPVDELVVVDRVGVLGRADDLRIDRVIGPTRYVVAPVGREAGPVLADDVFGEDVRLRVDVAGEVAGLGGDRPKRGRRVDGDRGGIGRAGGLGRRAAVERVTNLGAGRLGGDLDVEGIGEEPAINAERSVADQAHGTTGVGFAGRGFGEVLVEVLDRMMGQQPGLNEEIARARRMVHPVDRQHVVAGAELAEVARQVERNVLERLGHGAGDAGRGVPLRLVGGVVPGHLLSVKIGHKTVVVAHLQREGPQVVRVGHVELDPRPQRGVFAVHFTGHVGPHGVAEPGLAQGEPDAGRRRRGHRDSQVCVRIPDRPGLGERPIHGAVVVGDTMPLQGVAVGTPVRDRGSVPDVGRREREAVDLDVERVERLRRVSPDDGVLDVALAVDDHHPSRTLRVPAEDVAAAPEVLGVDGVVGAVVVAIENLPGVHRRGQRPVGRVYGVDLEGPGLVHRHHPAGGVDRFVQDALDFDVVGHVGARFGNQHRLEIAEARPVLVVEAPLRPGRPQGRIGVGGHPEGDFRLLVDQHGRHVGRPPVGDVLGLRGILGCVGVGDAVVGFEEGKILAAAAEFEAGVQVAVEVQRRVRDVLVGGHHQEILVGPDRSAGGERPALVAVAQLPAGKVHGRGVGIVDLDPVRRDRVFPRMENAGTNAGCERVVVDRHELADHGRAVEQHPAFERLEGQATATRRFRSARQTMHQNHLRRESRCAVET